MKFIKHLLSSKNSFKICCLLVLLISLTFELGAETQKRRPKGHGTYDENLNHNFPYTFFTSIKACGPFSWCDTIYIDSAHWGGTYKTRRLNLTNSDIEDKNSNGILANFYPNPTQDNGVISYSIASPFISGSLKVYDSFARLVYEAEIRKSSDQIKIPLEKNTTGLYLYFIRIDSGEQKIGRIIKVPN